MIERVELRPGYEIPRVIKGCWQLAGGHGAFDRDQAISDLGAFVDAGLNTLDCADIYTGVEEMIGAYISRDPNTEVQVHTKLVPDLDRLEVLGQKDIEAIVDRSLKRLCLERLHLLQFFWWDMAKGDPVAVMGTLKDLQAKGKIAHLGTTNFNQFDQEKFTQSGLELVSAQVQYSLLDARPAGHFTKWCTDHEVHLLCYGALAGGFLSEAWLGQADPGYDFENRSLIKYRLIIEEFGGWGHFQALLHVLSAIGHRHGATISTVAARWVLEQSQVAAVIIGARTASHLEKTLNIFELKLSCLDMAEIDDVRGKAKGLGGLVYALESDRDGAHGRIMKYNLGNKK